MYTVLPHLNPTPHLLLRITIRPLRTVHIDQHPLVIPNTNVLCSWQAEERFSVAEDEGGELPAVDAARVEAFREGLDV